MNSFTEPLFFICAGVLQLMKIGDIQRKDILDHPENYTLLTTLDEGLFPDFSRTQCNNNVNIYIF